MKDVTNRESLPALRKKKEELENELKIVNTKLRNL